MSFRDNLQHLRSTRNMTQEHLAMLLGVSRQSVSKWEAERAYPEMDKLQRLCDIFGCTLDELVSGDLTSREPEPAASMPSNAIVQDVTDYDDAARRHARTVPLGIAIIIAGLGLVVIADTPGLSERASDALSLALFFGCVAIGVAIIIIGAAKWGAFKKAHPFVEDFYNPDERSRATTFRAWMIAIGVVCCIAGIVLSSTADMFFSDYAGDFLTGVGFFFPVALGVWFIVYGAMMGGRVDLDAYNKEQQDELDDEKLDKLDEHQRERIVHARKMRNWYGAIMIGATIVALLWLFFVQAQYTKGFFWICWLVGGLVCGIVACVDKARR